MSIKAVFYSTEATHYLSQPSSIYRLKNQENMQIPSPDDNIVELELIECGGNLVVRQYDMASSFEREANTIFYARVKTVQKWMEKGSCK